MKCNYFHQNTNTNSNHNPNLYVTVCSSDLNDNVLEERIEGYRISNWNACLLVA